MTQIVGQKRLPTMKVDAADLDALSQRCADAGITMSAGIRRAISAIVGDTGSSFTPELRAEIDAIIDQCLSSRDDIVAFDPPAQAVPEGRQANELTKGAPSKLLTSVAVDVDIFIALDDMAKRLGTQKTVLIRRAIRNYGQNISFGFNAFERHEVAMIVAARLEQSVPPIDPKEQQLAS